MSEKMKLVSDLKHKLEKTASPRGGVGACWLHSSYNDSSPACRDGLDENNCAAVAQEEGFYAYSFQPGSSCRNPGHP